MASRVSLLLLCWVLLPQGVAQAKGKKARPTKAHVVKGARPAPEVTPPTPAAPVAVERRPTEEARPQAKGEEERELKRGERVEFDGRLIEGQTAAAGAIYLFERLPSELRSMVLGTKGLSQGRAGDPLSQRPASCGSADDGPRRARRREDTRTMKAVSAS